MERFKNLIANFPWIPAILLTATWFGYDYYGFLTSPDSPKIQKENQIQQIQTELVTLEAKVREAEEFYKSLEVKRDAIRALVVRLSQMKASLTEDLDIPQFILTTSTEAKKIGLRLLSIKPGKETKEEYYIEQGFDLEFKGVFAQLIVFMERLSNLQKIVRVDEFDIQPVGTSSGSAKYVELKGKLGVKVFRYAGSKADEVAAGLGKKS